MSKGLSAALPWRRYDKSNITLMCRLYDTNELFLYSHISILKVRRGTFYKSDFIYILIQGDIIA